MPYGSPAQGLPRQRGGQGESVHLQEWPGEEKTEVTVFPCPQGGALKTVNMTQVWQDVLQNTLGEKRTVVRSGASTGTVL